MAPLAQICFYPGFDESISQLDDITCGEALMAEPDTPRPQKQEPTKPSPKKEEAKTPSKSLPIRQANKHITKKNRAEVMMRMVERNPTTFDEVIEI